MTKFETLIFIPEGSLLNEKLAQRTALSQTLAALNEGFGPKERLQYTEIQEQAKLLGLNERIELTLQTFCKANYQTAKPIFWQKLAHQTQLVKGAISFLEQIPDQVKLVLLAKEPKQVISTRITDSKLLNFFSACYFSEDFSDTFTQTILGQVLQAEPAINPATCLLIGTDLADEIQAANQANLASVWLAPKKVKLPINPRPTMHLTRLSDLLFYLNLS
ncbi:HAD family hydrolase [Lactobacillus sp. ESL0684]|uniref:HAD family hydrolase n=1 Tax=Lactobacillus sp. ESL0684 TaxID=2983213 RepID=UPI0023F6E37D|nr:HAD family hydrolase [Lactobacillus sp. ESL0684]WEV44100.1 HAD family hydrolase [Lactobacillus sp. ESL0684]